MPIIPRVEIDQYAYHAAQEWVLGTPQTIALVVDSYVRPSVQDVVERDLVPYPPPIGRGVFKRLATPKQIRAVMAKIKRGEWTGRTGGLGRKWIVRAFPTQQGAVLEAGNTSKISQFVVGRYQQRFLQVTGWRTLQEREFQIVGAARAAFAEGYRTVQSQTFRRVQRRT